MSLTSIRNIQSHESQLMNYSIIGLKDNEWVKGAFLSTLLLLSNIRLDELILHKNGFLSET